MEAHAAVPGGDDLGGVLKVVARAVEQHVAETAADDDAEGDADDDAHDVVDRKIEVPASGDAAHHKTRHDKAREIREAVPAHRERPERESYRVQRLKEFVEEQRRSFMPEG